MTPAAALTFSNREGTTTKTVRTLSIAAGLLGLATSGIGGIEAHAADPTRSFTLSVVLDGSTFARTPFAPQGPEAAFAVEGDIFLADDCSVNENCTGQPPVGTFDGWGWIILDGSGNTVKEKVSQVYTIGVDGMDQDVLLDEGTGKDLVGGPSPELGRIMVQGLEIEKEEMLGVRTRKGFLAITGGTDDFTNLEGEAVMEFGDINPADQKADFEVTFSFTKAAAEAFSAE
jgi:hypothetical protein